MRYFRSVDEVQDFCKRNRISFVIYNEMVLDVSQFKHPGPQHLITDNLSSDVTDLFDETGHSDFAINLVKGLVIGKLNQGKLILNPYEKLTLREKEIHERLDQKIDIS